MRLSKFFAAILLSTSSLAMADQIWQPATHSQLKDMNALIDQSSLIVLGENHYDPAIVAIEAMVVDRVSLKNATTLGWEFLNTIDLPQVNSVEAKLESAQIDEAEALAELFPGSSAPVEYSALIAAAASPRVDLIPTNLTRAQKQPITAGGMEAADPNLVPPDFALGSDAYFSRFKEAMGPHPLPSPLENYFASQCITDDVMAYTLLAAKTPKKVLVTGAFHGDYKQGVVERLALRAPKEKILYIKIVEASDYTAEEFDSLLVDPVHGPIADIVYVVDPEGESETQSVKAEEGL